MKKLLLAAAVLLLVLIGLALYRAAQLQPRAVRGVTLPLPEIDRAGAADRLAHALAFPTVSQPDAGADNHAAFRAFADYLRLCFPLLHQRLKLEPVNLHSLLYTWPGSDPALAPVLLAAHLDVVPVEAEAEARWSQPPFDGVIADGYIWGRGALDDKNSLMAILEAAETLLAQGWQPRRTLIFAFGHDEEVGGAQGAKAIAARLAERGVKAAFSLDEGGAVTRGIVPGVSRPVASLMVGEKGYLSVRLRLHGDGGHSSTPPRPDVIGRLARAVSRLEDSPLPVRRIAAVDAMLESLAPEMDWSARVLIANRDVLSPLLNWVLSRSRTTDALIRTTTAATVFRAGSRDNVLPSEAEAVLDFRLLPGDTIDGLLQHLRETIDDEAVALEPMSGFNEAPPASSTDTAAYRLIERSINRVFPDAVVASGLVLGATDSRHYAAVREQAYHFSPMPYAPDDQARVHGIDERIAVADYVHMVQFYSLLMQHSGEAIH